MLHFAVIIVMSWMQWCDWWCYWYHVMLVPAQMASHDQRSHVAPLFDCLDLRNEFAIDKAIWHQVILVPMASHDQKHILHLILIVLIEKCNSSIDEAIKIIWCPHWHQWHHMAKKVKLHLISNDLPKKCNGALVDGVGTIWHGSQWHHMTKRDMLHIISIVSI